MGKTHDNIPFTTGLSLWYAILPCPFTPDSTRTPPGPSSPPVRDLAPRYIIWTLTMPHTDNTYCTRNRLTADLRPALCQGEFRSDCKLSTVGWQHVTEKVVVWAVVERAGGASHTYKVLHDQRSLGLHPRQAGTPRDVDLKHSYTSSTTYISRLTVILQTNVTYYEQTYFLPLPHKF